jgi:hypothetical protein
MPVRNDNMIDVPGNPTNGGTFSAPTLGNPEGDRYYNYN